MGEKTLWNRVNVITNDKRKGNAMAGSFKDFFNSIAAEIVDAGDSISELKIIISQLEPQKLCLFVVSDTDERYCYGHYGVCNMIDETNSISICNYFEIVRFLKVEYGLDVVLEWDWFLKLLM
jgi:hypothetical protein